MKKIFILSITGWIRLLLTLTLVLSIGCADSTETTEDTSTDDYVEPDPDDGGDVASPTSPLYLNFALQWLDTEDQASRPFTEMDTCEIPSGAAIGTILNCEIGAEEGRMLYSNSRFVISTATPDVCPIMEFRPYYYQRSAAASYYPPGMFEEVSCSPIPSALCYGGAAPRMIDSFPKATYFAWLAANTLSIKVNVPAERKVNHYGGYSVNYSLTNDSTNKMAATVTPTYKAKLINTWVDYKIECLDRWYHPQYTINLTVVDYDHGVVNHDGAEDEAPDWLAD